ncbi:MAG: TlpA family protein disulfide reductase [Hyphomonadaceae bacterium]|nr:TlpA family protein disulfide reductase [Hyphomonadaceae bacterium]
MIRIHAVSRVFTLANAIRLMVSVGLVAVFFVIVQSCQRPKTGLEPFRTGTLGRLEVLDHPPAQPQLTFSTADGREMTLADYHGRVVLLNVWATWCPPCLAEVPTLEALQSRRGADGFEVITISMDRTALEAAQWLDGQGISGLIPWHDSSRGLSNRLGALGLPVSIIYDPSGRELARVSGEADWASDEALALIDHVMAGQGWGAVNNDA